MFSSYFLYLTLARLVFGNNKLMTSTNPEKEGKETHAVNRLLEVAEKRRLLEQEWNCSERKDFIRSSKKRLGHARKSSQGMRYKDQEECEAALKRADKERLRQLIKDTIQNEEDSPRLPAKNSDRHNEDVSLTMKFLKTSKLRPFNSNMTFYGLKKEDRGRYISSSLTFYKKDAPHEAERGSSFRFVKNSHMDYEERYQGRESSNVIYFKPNKSETVRELLNQMRQERARNKEVVLNSTEKGPEVVEEDQETGIFSEQQLRVISRYKKFVPFRKDQNLLWKKMLEGDNIWLKKFRESWHRRKHEQEGKKPYFKRLIVKN